MNYLQLYPRIQENAATIAADASAAYWLRANGQPEASCLRMIEVQIKLERIAALLGYELTPKDDEEKDQ